MSVHVLGHLGDIYGASALLVRKTLRKVQGLKHCPLPHRDRRAPVTARKRRRQSVFAHLALGGLQPIGDAVERQPLPARFFLPAAGASTSCFRWPRSDGSCHCMRFASLAVPFPGVLRAVRSPNLSGSPARGSEGRRFPAAGGMGRESLRARSCRPLSGFGGNRRESRWPRAWPRLARPHVWPALPAAAEWAGDLC